MAVTFVGTIIGSMIGSVVGLLVIARTLMASKRAERLYQEDQEKK